MKTWRRDREEGHVMTKATNQGMPRNGGDHQKLEEARRDSSLETLERVWPH